MCPFCLEISMFFKKNLTGKFLSSPPPVVNISIFLPFQYPKVPLEAGVPPRSPRLRRIIVKYSYKERQDANFSNRFNLFVEQGDFIVKNVNSQPTMQYSILKFNEFVNTNIIIIYYIKYNIVLYVLFKKRAGVFY
jgi:hypothetical protein